jgi:uncharacterized ferritin-like protein (DUF455 family)
MQILMVRNYLVEQEVEYGDMKAHIDLWIPETGDVVDWKTVKKNNLILLS